MFKAHVLVCQDTDVAAESAKIEALANKNHLDGSRLFALMRDVESVLGDLKQQDSETAVHGIKISATKTLATDAYVITFELRPRSATKKSGLLSRIFGR